ncbi:MAG: hypothetical protein MUO21_09835, partial [Nitrososphaeraceae archaeon]|nr:hypothetical protein [Nitrososphaeraceae archaeon]
MKIIVISSLLILLLLSSTFLLPSLTPVNGQESITINCSFENAKLTKIGHSLEQDREEMRENYKRYGDSALNALNSLPEEMAEIIKTNLETEILMEKIKTNSSIEYKNCSHINAVEIELTNLLKQGEDEWNEYWNNQETGLGNNEIKQMKEYIKLHIHNE